MALTTRPTSIVASPPERSCALLPAVLMSRNESSSLLIVMMFALEFSRFISLPSCAKTELFPSRADR